MTNELYKSNIYTKVLGKQIRNRRKWKDKSIQRLAEDTGFSVNHINNIELGKSQPATGLFHAICDVLEIDATSFLRKVREEVELFMPEEQ